MSTFEKEISRHFARKITTMLTRLCNFIQADSLRWIPNTFMRAGSWVGRTNSPVFMKEKKVNEKESLPIVQRSKILNITKIVDSWLPLNFGNTFPGFKATFKEATRFRSAEVTKRFGLCRTAIKWSASPAKSVCKSIAEIDRLKILRRKAGGLCPPDPPRCNIHETHVPCAARRSHKFNFLFGSDARFG